MLIKVKKLSENAVIPSYAKKGDAAMDLTAVNKKVTDKFIEYGTGLAFEIPKDHVGLIFPRSSVSKKDLFQCNSVGVLDSGYRGELSVRFNPLGEDHYEVGERIAQLIVIPLPEVEVEEVEELEDSDRGGGGWGSTGK
jgi:dUTP pyrophosphatase